MFNRVNIAKDFAKRIKSDNITQIILFGSVARGDDTEDSDIDVLIISPDTRIIQDKIDDEVVEIILETNQFISAHLMTEEHFNKTKNHSFLKNVFKEGVIMDEVGGYVNLSKEDLESGLILLEAGQYRNSISSSYLYGCFYGNYDSY